MALLMSRRARRMDQHHKRGQKNATLSLVSLMDIFTILVFFLLVNASEVEVLPSPKHIQLPESSAEQRPEETVIVMLAQDHILVNGQQVVSSEELSAGNWQGSFVKQLQQTLEAIPPKIVEDSENEEVLPPAITVMGDKTVPFARVRQVMKACGSAGFGSVSLAVEKIIDGPQVGDTASGGSL
ncbi:MAG: biopolymer transporter ExbD [Gammaproteobacteria bacterium]|nr:biopolymer transporter ExbD [Gammaproteobacteria bacterium]